MSSFFSLPREALEEIMSLAPADSLIQFKRVNKSCYSLISDLINDPLFVAKHLRNTKKSSPSLIFTRSCTHLDHDETDCHGDIFSLVTILNGNRDDGHVFSVTEELNLPPPPCEGDDRLVRWRKAYHCNGIICLVQDPRTIIVCNPVLQECKLLPVSNYARNVGDPLHSAMGFGHDSRANQYKFVAISNRGMYNAEVHTLGTDSWRELVLPQDTFMADFLSEEAVYHKGVCYWVMEHFGGYEMILCFDMSKEEFSVTQFPDLENVEFLVDWAGVSIWNDNVSLVVCSKDYETDDNPLFIEIFELDDYSSGDKDASCWTKQLSFQPIKDFASTSSIIQNNEFLMRGRDGRLVSYNLRTQNRRDVAVPDVDRLRHWDCLYEKSLVSVKKSNLLATSSKNDKVTLHSGRRFK